MRNDKSLRLLAAGSVVLVALLIGFLSLAFSGSSEDLLTIVREGSRDTAASIQSGRGNITMHVWSLDRHGAISESEFVYAVAFIGDRFRLSEREFIIQNVPGGAEDGKLLVPAGTVRHREVAYDGDTLTVYYPEEHRAVMESMEYPGGKELPYWNRISPRACWLDEIPTKPIGEGGTATARRQTLNGIDYIVVEIVQTDTLPTKTTAWVDTSKGFTLARLFAYGYDDGSIPDIGDEQVLLDKIVAEPREYGEGFWGPAEFTLESYRRGADGDMRRALSEHVTYAPDFLFNVPVDESDLKLILPSGTSVYHKTLKARYTVR